MRPRSAPLQKDCSLIVRIQTVAGRLLWEMTLKDLALLALHSTRCSDVALQEHRWIERFNGY